MAWTAQEKKGYYKQYFAENKEKLKEQGKRLVSELSPSYVAQRMGLNLKTAPKELIEIKRLQLLITREIRAKKC